MPPPTAFQLNNGVSMPAIGIGCWMGLPLAGEGDHVVDMVSKALKAGYRHIDTAANYGNERSVGKSLRESGVPRSEVFLTTKLDQKDHARVAQALDESLEKLGVDYVDLYLVHWPIAVDPETGRTLQPEEHPTIRDTWLQMEAVLRSGKTRSIGLSNFSVKTLSQLLAPSVSEDPITVVPAVNQVELHPFLPQHALLAFCKERNVHLTAYSPVGKGEMAGEEALRDIAKAQGASVAQVLLGWARQRGTSVVPKTVNEGRMRENLEVIELSADEMQVIDDVHRKTGNHRSVCKYHSAELGGSCFGWTYEQLGWDMAPGGVVPSTTTPGL